MKGFWFVKVPGKQTRQLPHSHWFPRTEEEFTVYFAPLNPAFSVVIWAH